MLVKDVVGGSVFATDFFFSAQHSAITLHWYIVAKGSSKQWMYWQEVEFAY